MRPKIHPFRDHHQEKQPMPMAAKMMWNASDKPICDGQSKNRSW
jgi:hypothetical protein